MPAPDISLYFRALADRKRLRMVEYLAQHEHVAVTQLGAELRMSQPLISWHLRMLRRAGIVKTRRSGRQVLCSLNRRSLLAYQQRLADTLALDTSSEYENEQVPRVLEAARQA